MRGTTNTLTPFEVGVVDESNIDSLARIYLNTVEQHQKEYICSAKRQHQWLAGRIAAKRALRSFYLSRYRQRMQWKDFVITNDSLGKPEYYSKRKLVDISISHSMNIGVATVSERQKEGRVGIDIEYVRPLKSSVQGAFLNDYELARVDAEKNAGSIKRAVLYWSLKEAYLKALGVGLRFHPRAVTIHETINPQIYTVTSTQGLGSASISYEDDHFVVTKVHIENND